MVHQDNPPHDKVSGPPPRPPPHKASCPEQRRGSAAECPRHRHTATCGGAPRPQAARVVPHGGACCGFSSASGGALATFASRGTPGAFRLPERHRTVRSQAPRHRAACCGGILSSPPDPCCLPPTYPTRGRAHTGYRHHFAETHRKYKPPGDSGPPAGKGEKKSTKQK